MTEEIHICTFCDKPLGTSRRVAWDLVFVPPPPRQPYYLHESCFPKCNDYAALSAKAARLEQTPKQATMFDEAVA